MEVKNRPKYRQIIEAAVRVIAENGFHHAQVSKIAKEAGVADGTIYLYFANKEDLLISVFQDKMGQFVDKIHQETAREETVKDQLEVLVRLHFSQLEADRDLAIVTQLELRQSNKNIRLKINGILKKYLDLIDAVIIEGQKQGVFREDLDVRLARQMIFGTLDETVSNWVMNDQKFDLLELTEPVSSLLLNGLMK